MKRARVEGGNGKGTYKKSNISYKNSKSEYRNPKQIQMTKIQMTKTGGLAGRSILPTSRVLNLGNLNFGFVSDFVLLIYSGKGTYKKSQNGGPTEHPEDTEREKNKE
jgi:hypothetical protein